MIFEFLKLHLDANISKIMKIRGILQKFCVVQPFSACGNTVASKLGARVTEGISSAHAKFCSNQLKITQ